MNQKQRPKIELFLSGFFGRYREAADYFIRIDFDLVSGRKTYTGSITPEENAFLFSFSGNRMTSDLSEALKWLTDEMLKYDAATVRYCERGGVSELIADAKNMRVSRKEDTSSAELPRVSVKKKNEYQIDLHKAQKLMQVLGYCDESGKLRNDMIRKYNQTNHIISLAAPLFDGAKDLTVVDCACGKSYLSFVLNHYLWEERHIRAHFVGIDISEQVIKDSKAMAAELGYSNMEFRCEDLRTFESDFHPDLVMSLHACDTATDMALGYALRHRAERILCVPCCHKELLKQYRIEDFEPITKHGIFRARLNDLITDGLRTLKLEAEGYDVRCVEFCSPLDTPKNLLITARKVSGKNEEAQLLYDDLLRKWSVRPSVEYYSMPFNPGESL